MEKFEFDILRIPIRGSYVFPIEARGVVVLVHGFGEHSGRYSENVVPMLLKNNLAVVCYDNIGHGISGGKRGHCPSYEVLLDVLEQVINKASNRFPQLPLYLYGHSMGGNLVLNYTMRRKPGLAGLIATSPYLRLAFAPPKWKIIVGKLLLKIIPSVTLPAGLDSAGISQIPAEVAKYNADPLIFDQVSPMYSFPIMDAGEWAIKEAANLKVDALLMHGTSDPIIDHRATIAFHERATTTTLHLFEGAYHELHHDLCKQEMLSKIEKWLVERLQ